MNIAIGATRTRTWTFMRSHLLAAGAAALTLAALAGAGIAIDSNWANSAPRVVPPAASKIDSIPGGRTDIYYLVRSTELRDLILLTNAELGDRFGAGEPDANIIVLVAGTPEEEAAAMGALADIDRFEVNLARVQVVDLRVAGP